MMCEQLNELFLDYLYGLLEEDQAASLREHLAICATCQASLKEAQEQQRLLTRAAQVCIPLAAFTAPDFDAPIAQPASEAIVEATALPLPTPTEPTPTTSTAQPGARWRRLVSLVVGTAVAAAILVAGFKIHDNYQDGLALRQAALKQAGDKVDAIDAKFAAATQKFEVEKQRISTTEAGQGLQVQVSGPAQIHAESTTPLLIEVRDGAGKPKNATVSVQMLDAATKTPLADEEKVLAKGEYAYKARAGLGNEGNVLMVVKASTPDGWAQVEQTLSQAPTTHVTHLALNKSSYQIGELLFFRTLSLQHFSLRPPETPLHLRYSLVDLKGKTVKQLDGVTGPGGIGGGELALTPDIPVGIYSLEVTPINGSQALRQRRRVEIVRESTPVVETDRAQYMPGEKGYWTFRDRSLQNAPPIPNLPLTMQPQMATVPTAGGVATPPPPQPVRTNEQGQIPFTVPDKVESNRLPYAFVFPAKDGKDKGAKDRAEQLVQSLPIMPSKLDIDFFPEGGELVEGVPTRVYYRVRTPKGEPVNPQGRVIVLSSDEVLHDSEPGQGLGYFALTPRKNETYTVRLTGPEAEFTDPFGKLGIRSEGLVLNMPAGVTRDGEAIEAVLGYKGEPKRLLLLVSCRGQIVEQKTVIVHAGTTKVQLNPVKDTAGVLRITVYEVDQGDLTPLAERLVFRVPGRRLDLTAATANGKGKMDNVKAGQNVKLEVQGKDEAGKGRAYWALGAVVDEQAASTKEPGLAAHFYLISDVRNGEDLDEAHLVLRDDAESWKSLDLFLGTQGWRKFVAGPAATANPTLVALSGLGGRREDKTGQENKKGEKKDGTDAKGDSAKGPGGAAQVTAAYFSKQSADLNEIRERQEGRTRDELAGLYATLVAERAKLATEKEARAREYDAVALELSDYRDAMMNNLRLGAGIACLAVLIVGALLLLASMVRMMRQRSATPVFAGAFLSLAIGIVLYLIQPLLNQEGERTIAHNFRPLPNVPPLRVAEVVPAKTEPTLPPGIFAPRDQDKEKVAEARATAADPATVMRNTLEELAPLAKRSEVLAMDTFRGSRGGPDLQLNQSRSKEPLQRYKDVAKSQKENPVQPVAPPTAPYPDPKKQDPFPKTTVGKASDKHKVFGGKSNAELNRATAEYSQNSLRQFNFREESKPPLEQSDTVLWHPALFSEDGRLLLNFDLPSLPATYRVLIYANDPEGRLGYFQGTLVGVGR